MKTHCLKIIKTVPFAILPNKCMVQFVILTRMFEIGHIDVTRFAQIVLRLFRVIFKPCGKAFFAL